MTNLLNALVNERARYWAHTVAIASGLFAVDIAQAQDEGVCARVGLRLDQSAVVTRTAFRATLEISNHDPSSTLTAVGAQVQIRDAGGQLAHSLFQIEVPTLQNIDRVDGSGTLAANGKATIRWMLIPSDQAAPVTATEFFVGGQFSYTLKGIQLQVPLEGVKITVYPDAALDLTYFHQRDVFSDDPFTPEVEPSLPYTLVVMIKNRGAGAAKSLKITSSQPQIISNDKGLLIDFKLIGTSVDGTNFPNTLAVDFGRIEPGEIKAASWLFTSTLQGFFRDFSATFQHEDTLGSIRLSTIKSVSIREMTHVVDAGYQFADGKPDFLVNGVADDANLPDTLYLSDGSTNPVQVVTESSVAGVPSGSNPQVQLTASMPPGWTYLRVPDPSAGQLVLNRVTRSDGIELKVGTNVWTTDRLFPAPGLPVIRTNILHLLDYNSPGTYALFYAPLPLPDTVAPASAVAALPANSRISFPVRWSGQDEVGGSGISYFDIFVSVNGGPVQAWLEHTTLSGAIYTGAENNSYAFYSVGTDVAGNHEAPPGTADAQTTTSMINHAPAFVGLTDRTVNEGEEFTLALSATDPDLPDDGLTFSLGAGVPPGMIIDPATGYIRWATGEGNGPSTNLITVVVTDNGVPSVRTSNIFRLIVNEVNQAPSLAAIPDRTVSEGALLSFAALASDTDLPANVLHFNLAPGAPSEARIDPATGLFTWIPSEDDGGTTKRIGIVVSDNGTPMLSATQTFSVVVTEANSAPTIATIPTQSIEEETTLTLTIGATDVDRPANALTFSLRAGAPTGASIEPTTGAFTWTPTEEQGPSTNDIQVIVTDNGSPSLSATQTLRVVVTEVNWRPSFVSVPNQTAFVQSALRVTNIVIDTDIPTNKMSFSLALGAPAGSRINTNSGVFSWTPSKAQAPSSNFMSIIVTDDGVPPLSATNSFSVHVGDFIELTLGSTNVEAGQTSSVPITIITSGGVTNVQFTLDVPWIRLTNLSLQSIAPGVGSASIDPVIADRSVVRFTAQQTELLAGTQNLAQLVFTANPNQTSAFVPLIVSELSATQPNGLEVPRMLSVQGRVTVVGTQSLLEALPATNGHWTLMLYGKIDGDYVLEYATNLEAPIDWRTYWDGRLTDVLRVFDLPMTNGMLMLRARER